MSGKACAVAECGKTALCKGLCSKHYTRLSRYGDVNQASKNIRYYGVGEYDKELDGSLGGEHHQYFYAMWSNMIERAYSPAILKRCPTYIEVTVADDFRKFRDFFSWVCQQPGCYLSGFELDKDLLSKGQKVYSSLTCALLPREINKMLIKRKVSKSGLPQGVLVRNDMKGFIAQCHSGSRKKYLGVYKSAEKAFLAYKDVKEGIIKELAEKHKDNISEAAYIALMNWEVKITD